MTSVLPPPRRQERAGFRVNCSGLARLAELRQEWSALCDRSPGTTPFQRPEWLIPWCRAFPPREPWVLEVRDAGDAGRSGHAVHTHAAGTGRLIGLLPLFLYDKEGERTLAMAGAGYSDYLDLVAEPGREEEAIAALFAALEERAELWEACDLEQLRPGSPLLAAPLPAGWSERREPQDACPALDLPAAAGELGQVVPTRMLSNLRRFRRKISEIGDLRLERAGPGLADWGELFDALVAMHRARWDGRGLPGVLDEPAVQGFHREVIPGFLAQGALDLLALHLSEHLGERCVAIYYGLRERDRAYGYLQGYDPAWERFSPGVLVLGAAFEELIATGVRRYDFLRGREEYKYRWGAADRWNHRRTLRRGPL